MVNRPGHTTPPYSQAQTTQWLAWLAHGMQRHSQSVFLIEQLQPSWLPTRGQRWAYILSTRLIFGLVLGLVIGLLEELGGEFVRTLSAGLIFGLAFGLLGGCLDGWQLARSSIGTKRGTGALRWQIAVHTILGGLLGALIFGPVGEQLFDLAFGLDSGLIGGIVVGLMWGFRSARQSLTSDVQTVEALTWSWAHARKGGVKGAMVGLLFGLVVALILEGLEGWAEAGADGLVSLLAVGFAVGVLGGLFGVVFSGLRGSLAEMKTIPNQGIKLSIRNAARGGGYVALIGALIVLPIGMQEEGFPAGLVEGLVAGLFVGFVAALWYGGFDVIQHYVLRIILHRKGHLPWKLTPFLDYAAEDLQFLQKVGGGYLFIHRYLLEHFAAMHPSRAAPRPAASSQTGILDPHPA